MLGQCACAGKYGIQNSRRGSIIVGTRAQRLRGRMRLVAQVMKFGLQRKDYKNEAWWAISYSWIILGDLNYVHRNASTTLSEPGFLYLSLRLE
jgi:hypothetical protein